MQTVGILEHPFFRISQVAEGNAAKHDDVDGDEAHGGEWPVIDGRVGGVRDQHGCPQL
jgi:hypothetical protein